MARRSEIWGALSEERGVKGIDSAPVCRRLGVALIILIRRAPMELENVFEECKDTATATWRRLAMSEGEKNGRSASVMAAAPPSLSSSRYSARALRVARRPSLLKAILLGNSAVQIALHREAATLGEHWDA